MTYADILKKYSLSLEEHNKINDEILQIMTTDKYATKNPVAIIDIGAPGSGKTGLNGYALSQFENNNLIIVNNDELRPFHKYAKELAELYPEHYIKVTNENSKYWTDNLMDYAILNKLNVLYEGTGRKIKIYENMINKMKEKGYKIIVRVMAVSDFNCLMSIYERYIGQVKTKGWGRLVSSETFYKSYDNEMIDTLVIFEEKNMVDEIEVYVRGEKPTNPVRIYSSKNHEFESVSVAIETGRIIDYEKAMNYYDSNFKYNEFYNLTESEQEIINKINELYNQYENKYKK